MQPQGPLEGWGPVRWPEKIVSLPVCQPSFLCLLAPSIVKSLDENQGSPLSSPSGAPTLEMQDFDMSRRIEVLSRVKSRKCLGSLNIVTEQGIVHHLAASSFER